MKAPFWFVPVAPVVAACMLSSTAFASTTSEVYQLTISASGVIQDNVNGSPAVTKAKLTSAGFVNLAMGRSPQSAVPVNEVLAIALTENADGGVVVVYDTNTHSTKATLGEVTYGGTVKTATAGSFCSLLDVGTVGSSTYGFHGGYVMLSGKSPMPPTKFRPRCRVSCA